MCIARACFAFALPSSLIIIIAAISQMKVGSQVQVKWEEEVSEVELQHSKCRSRSKVPKKKQAWYVGKVRSIEGDVVEVQWPGPGKQVQVSHHPISDIHPYEFAERPTPKATRYSITVFFADKNTKKRKRQ